MTKTTASALVLTLLLAGSRARAAQAPPAPGGRVAEYEAAQRGFMRAGDFQPAVELAERWQYSERSLYRAASLGTYYRAERHLRLGAFYRIQYGARHDDDWQGDPGKSWAWRDTTRRPESVLALDATPRLQLTESLVASARVRLERNFFSAEDVLKLEPELAWFWMDGLTPRATFFLRHEVVFPLNFGQTTVWQRWYYAAGLWHATPSLSLGPSFALREEVWSTSSSFRGFAPSESGYQTLFRSWVLGFELIARLPG